MHRRKFEGFGAAACRRRRHCRLHGGLQDFGLFGLRLQHGALQRVALLTWLSIAAVVAASFCREPCERPSQKLTTVANAAAKAPTVILMIWATWSPCAMPLRTRISKIPKKPTVTRTDTTGAPHAIGLFASASAAKVERAPFVSSISARICSSCASRFFASVFVLLFRAAPSEPADVFLPVHFALSAARVEPAHVFLLSRRDFRKLELQRGDRRRIGVELVPSLFGILRLGDLRDSLGNGACDRYQLCRLRPP